jgi:hypothetical protein
MINRIRTPLGIVAVGAIIFATVFATAASLTVNTDALPQSGSDVSAVCDADGVDVGYTVSGGNVTEIVVSDDDCATGTITLTTTPGYAFDETGTQANAATVTFTLTTPVSIASFDPGTVSVTLIP